MVEKGIKKKMEEKRNGREKKVKRSYKGKKIRKRN